MRKLTIWVPALLIATFLVQPPAAALAQVERHVVTIDNGKVFIDGKRIADRDLPASLKLKDMLLSWSFTGDALLELRGTVYELQDGKLVEADEDIARDGRVMVFFRDPDDNDSVVRVLSRAGAVPFGRFKIDQSHGVVMENYLEALQNKAKEFELIRGQIADQNADQALVLADRLRLEAENTARIAQAFPRVEFESYLEGIHETDLKLYGQLMLERNIETETHRLAMEARAAQDWSRREKIVAELREKLNNAFELKQQNREKEIEQLGERLNELREKLSQRADLRDRIIESRLKELLGELDW